MSQTPRPSFALPIGANDAREVEQGAPPVRSEKPDIDDDLARSLADRRGDPAYTTPNAPPAPQEAAHSDREASRAEDPAQKSKGPSGALKKALGRIPENEPAEFTRLGLPLPDYVIDQLKNRAHETDATVRHVIMTALKAYRWKAAGESQQFHIRDADMATDFRKKAHRKKRGE